MLQSVGPSFCEGHSAGISTHAHCAGKTAGHCCSHIWIPEISQSPERSLSWLPTMNPKGLRLQILPGLVVSPGGFDLGKLKIPGTKDG